MNMTREQKLKRADETFARVFGGDRTTADAVNEAMWDARSLAEDLDDTIQKIEASLTVLETEVLEKDSDPYDAAGNIGEALDYLRATSQSLCQLAERLDALDFSERVA